MCCKDQECTLFVFNSASPSLALLWVCLRAALYSIYSPATVSGRVIRKDLPLLAKYHVVATTHGGFFVLADKEPPHAAVVLNPFTGHMIRFKAAVPPYVDVSAAALSGHSSGKLFLNSYFSKPRSSSWQRSSPTLILLWDICYEQYMAVPDSDSFAVELDDELLDFLLDNDDFAVESNDVYVGPFTFMRLAVTGGICAADGWQYSVAPLPGAAADKIYRLMKLFAIDHNKMFSQIPATGFADLPGTGDANHLFLVESAGKLFAIVKLQQHLKVFRLNNGEELEPIKSIGDCAIFVGYRRCISVSTGKFTSVVANCVYFVKPTDSSLDIFKYDLENETEDRVSEAIDSLNPITMSFASPRSPSFSSSPATPSTLGSHSLQRKRVDSSFLRGNGSSTILLATVLFVV